MLVALLLLAETGSMHLVRVHKLLNSLDTHSKKRLGITRKGGVTRRQVERLYGLMAHAMNNQDISVFDEFCDLLMQSTLDPSTSETTSIAIDSTSIDSWGKRKKHRESDGTFTWVTSDHDAAWRRKSKDNPWKRPVFGFDLTVAVTIPEIKGPDVALAARAIRFRAANTESVEMGRAVVLETARQQGVLGDVVADREYTSTMSGSDFILPVRALGGEPVFDLTKHQLGAHGTTHGAIMIDGQPFSPSTPPGLHLIVPPPPGRPFKEIADYQAQIATRARYALVPHGSRSANGSQIYQCPASAGKLSCPLVPSSPDDAFPALLAPTNPAPGSVCTKSYTTFHAADTPLAQRDLFGSNAWFKSMSRRSRVEGFFGNVKNEACEHLRRGTIRVRGLVKTGMLVAFTIAATNLRLAIAFTRRTPKPLRPRRGRPKKKGVIKYADIFTTTTAANAPPGAA